MHSETSASLIISSQGANLDGGEWLQTLTKATLSSENKFKCD